MGCSCHGCGTGWSGKSPWVNRAGPLPFPFWGSLGQDQHWKAASSIFPLVAFRAIGGIPGFPAQGEQRRRDHREVAGRLPGSTGSKRTLLPRRSMLGAGEDAATSADTVWRIPASPPRQPPPRRGLIPESSPHPFRARGSAVRCRAGGEVMGAGCTSLFCTSAAVLMIAHTDSRIGISWIREFPRKACLGSPLLSQDIFIPSPRCSDQKCHI